MALTLNTTDAVSVALGSKWEMPIPAAGSGKPMTYMVGHTSLGTEIRHLDGTSLSHTLVGEGSSAMPGLLIKGTSGQFAYEVVSQGTYTRTFTSSSISYAGPPTTEKLTEPWSREFSLTAGHGARIFVGDGSVPSNTSKGFEVVLGGTHSAIYLGIDGMAACYIEYCNAHSDLKAHFCGGECHTEAHASACEKHWKDHGTNQERSHNPDQCAGTKPCSNEDLVLQSASQMYLGSNGKHEELRLATSCDWDCYRHRNPDLANMNNEQAEAHWINHGIKEKRQCTCETSKWKAQYVDNGKYQMLRLEAGCNWDCYRKRNPDQHER